MRTVDRIRQNLSVALQDVHQARVTQVFALVAALVKGGCATLTAIGRALAVATTEKHGIKRADRCIGNPRLHAERHAFWGALAGLALAGCRHPRIVVDWTDLGSGFAALRAAVVLRGRALGIFCQVHSVCRVGDTRIERNFLKSLQRVLPADCRPVIITDSGFQSSWFKQVLALGWDFVGRLRRHVTVRPVQRGVRLNVSSLQRQAINVAKDCGEFVVMTGRSREFSARIITFDGRTQRARRSSRPKQRRGQENKGAARAHRPLVTVTSVPDLCAKDVIQVYRLRMQIEETFRDDKSSRFGWQLEFARSRNPVRLEILLLLVALATLAAAIAGFAAIASNLPRHFQANTIRSRTVLSIITLGRRALARLNDLPSDSIATGFRDLNAAIRAAQRA